jgi:glucokinase
MRNAIGIDIGGTHTRAARVSGDGGILVRVSGPTAAEPELVLQDIAAKVAQLRDGETSAIGVGVPGRVNTQTGEVLSGGFVDLSTIPFSQNLGSATGLRVVADNDANMALLGEAAAGAARGYSHVVMLTIGTGIGGAILTRSKIFRGGGTAGQLGHITVTAQGRLCNCGRSGCLETECSGTALRRLMADAGFGQHAAIGAVLQDQSAAARQVVKNWATPLRAGIDSLVATVGPETVVLGGGLGAAAVSALERVPAVSPWFQYPVVAARLGDEAGVIGAALAALEAHP